jgi:hypothetical protein
VGFWIGDADELEWEEYERYAGAFVQRSLNSRACGIRART